MKKVELIKVFIASPSDITSQRDIVEKLIWQWNNEHTDSREIILMPIRWENNSTPSYRDNKDGQGVINEQLLEDSDILIAVFGNKIGSKTRSNTSGTIEEIEYFYKKNKRGVGVFFIETDKIPKDLFSEYQEVQAYQKKLQDEYNGIYSSFDSDKVRHFLTTEVNQLIAYKAHKDVSTNRLISEISIYNKTSIFDSDTEKQPKIISKMIFPSKKEMKNELIEILEQSKSFHKTHNTIASLEEYLGSFSDDETKRIINAGCTNDQVVSILDDPDIKKFYGNLMGRSINGALNRVILSDFQKSDKI